MKRIASTLATIVLAWGSTGGIAAPVDARLDYVSNNLTFATRQLVMTIQAAQGNSHDEMDAETLYDAAEHFKEEVELGPEDLDVDFNVINQTYREMRFEIGGSELVRCNRQVREAWFNTQEAFVSLRQAWLSHTDDHLPGPGPVPGPGPGPGPAPYPYYY